MLVDPARDQPSRRAVKIDIAHPDVRAERRLPGTQFGRVHLLKRGLGQPGRPAFAAFGAHIDRHPLVMGDEGQDIGSGFVDHAAVGQDAVRPDQDHIRLGHEQAKLGIGDQGSGNAPVRQTRRQPASLVQRARLGDNRPDVGGRHGPEDGQDGRAQAVGEKSLAGPNQAARLGCDLAQRGAGFLGHALGSLGRLAPGFDQGCCR